MIESLKKLGAPALAALSIVGCPEQSDISDQQTITRGELGCIVLCEGDEPGRPTTTYQCHPNIPEHAIEKAMTDARIAWRKLSDDNKPLCPRERFLGTADL